MRTFKILMRIVAVVLVMSISVFAATLNTDDFTNGLQSWTGTGVTQYTSGATKRMEIATQSTASKTYTFSANANQAITLTLDAVKVGTWSSSDHIVIIMNGNTVYDSSTSGNGVVFNGSFNGSGSLNITIKANTDNASKKLQIDNIILATGSAYTVDNFRNFTLVNQNNILGDMKIVGNSVMRKTGGVCPGTTGSNIDNNDIDPVWANVGADGNASIYNSTSADLTLPAGVDSTKIKYAGLYWQGRVDNGESFTAGKTILFKPQGIASYQSVTSADSKFNWSIRAGTDKSYQGIADVTSLIKQSIDTILPATITSTGYSGTLWAANILAKQMRNGFGAWSLVVVYEDSADTLKNISVYDGYKEVTGSNTVTVPLTGFLTPKTAPVNSKFLFFGGEGDISLDDSISLTNKAGNDITLGNNVFNSSETNASGSNITARNPSCQNTIGIDIHTVNVGTNGSPSIIGTEQNSTIVKLQSGGDTYYPGVFAFSTDLYEPDVCYVENIFKGTTNISGIGAQVNQDDNLTVRVYIKNKGTETASGVRILHSFDSSFPYVANSANYNNSNPGYQTIMPPSYTRTSASDSSGNDLYEYNSTSLLSKINLGIGANATSGGTFNTTSSASPTYAVFEYNATVKILDNNYSNVYQAGYINSVLGIDYSNNPVTIKSCDGSKNSFYGYSAPVATGTIDAVDTYSNATYTDANGPDIQTKVASTPNVTLQAVWLGSTNAPQAYSNTTYDTPVIMRLSDSTCTTDENLTNSVTGVVATFVKNTTFTAVTSNSFTIVPNARPNAKVKLSYINWSKKFQDANFNCANSNNDATLLGVPACLASATQMTNAFGAAVSAACSATGTRPACSTSSYNNTNVPSYPYDNDYGCYQCLAGLVGQNTCSTDIFALRPKDFFTNLTAGQVLVAKQPASITIQARDYSNVATAGYNETENSSFKGDVNISDSTKTCTQPSITFSPNINFSEGSATGNYNFGNVGDFNVTIHEINGTEFSHVDFDDTSDTNRIITPFTQQIKIIPAHFTVDGNLTNGSNGFTYLSNFQDYNTTASRNISAGLDLNITAQAFDNNVTSNYTSTCYAKDGNINVAINPFAMTPAGAVTKMIWYEVNHDTNGSMGIPVNSFIMPFVHNAFDAAGANGTARVKYKLNFDRSQTKTVDPRSLIATNITVTDADTVSGAKIPTTNSAYYVYGRIVPRNIRTFGSDAFTANAWYEVFNTTSIGATELPASKNDPLWFTSILHNDVNDGNSDVTVVITGANPASAAAVNGMEAYSFGAGYALGGYNAHIRTAPWLLYGSTALPYRDPANPANLDCLTHPCFNVNMIPSIGASGSAKSTNRTTKESKKSTVETGGWKSTNDYAPAIL